MSASPSRSLGKEHRSLSSKAGDATAKDRRVRKPVSCKPCRRSKLRCDRHVPCSTCKRRDCVASCTLESHPPKQSGHHPEPVSTAGNPSLITPAAPPTPTTVDYRAAFESSNSRPTAQSPLGFAHDRWDAILRRPNSHTVPTPNIRINNFDWFNDLCFPWSLGPKIQMKELLAIIPAPQTCECLISHYFQHMSPLFHILHGPTFEKDYRAFVRDPSNTTLSWLALVFIVLSMAVHAIDDEDGLLRELCPQALDGFKPEKIAQQYRTAALMALSMDSFLIHHDLNTLEALLLLCYSINHWEGVEYSWALLGMARNMGMSLHCNINPNIRLEGVDYIDLERRSRCWAGILLLHTNQAISYPDIDMSSFPTSTTRMPAIVNDTDIQANGISTPKTHITQMSVMQFKLEIFHLSSRICVHLSNQATLPPETLAKFDSEILAQQQRWESSFLVNGSPSILEASSHAYWCILQLYAHQLYLLLYRPTRHSSTVLTGSHSSELSREKCVKSGEALLDLHGRLFSLPTLRPYRWYIYGMTSLYAVHGAVALASCLLDDQGGNVDTTHYRVAFDAAINRIAKLQDRSQVCAKAYPFLQYLRSMLLPGQFQWAEPTGIHLGNTLDEWIDNVDWLNHDTVNWEFWDDILNTDSFSNVDPTIQ
ncbi:hypothetical protein ACMFMG_011735 [Clarireedia jacksonii]